MDPSKSVKTDNAVEKRETIAWALYQCLSEQGQERISIKKIALKAGLPQGVIHYYFSSKDEIISYLAEAIIERFSALFYEQLENIDNEQQLSFMIDYIVDVLIFNRELNQVFYNLVQMTFERESLRKVMSTMLQNYREKMADIFRKHWAHNASHDIGAALVAITEGFTLQVLIDPESFKPETVREIIKQRFHDLMCID